MRKIIKTIGVDDEVYSVTLSVLGKSVNKKEMYTDKAYQPDVLSIEVEPFDVDVEIPLKTVINFLRPEMETL